MTNDPLIDKYRDPPLLARTPAGASQAITHGPYMLRRFVRPRSSLSRDDKAMLMPICKAVSSEMVGADLSEYWERRDYFQELSEWWLVTAGREVVGWAGIKILPGVREPLLYIDTVGFRHAHHRHGLATLLTVAPWSAISREHRRLMTMTFRTQSPVVLRAAANLGGRYAFPYPSSGTAHRSDRAFAAAQVTAEHLGPPGIELEREFFVSRGVFSYMGSLYGEKLPLSGEPQLDSRFTALVDTNAGDALIGVMLGTPGFAVRALKARRKVTNHLRELQLADADS